MWRWYTAEDRRQAAAVILLLVVGGGAVVAATPVIAGADHHARSEMRRTASQPVRDAGQTSSAHLWRRPAEPAEAFGVARDVAV